MVGFEEFYGCVHYRSCARRLRGAKILLSCLTTGIRNLLFLRVISKLSRRGTRHYVYPHSAPSNYRMRLHGRGMQEHVPPFNYIFPKVDISNPRTFLWIKRGILQYTLLKPFLAFATIIMKATHTFEDGYIGLKSGYFWSGLLYNLSVTISLYSLGFFWLCLYWDLKPFRPVPKVLTQSTLTDIVPYRQTSDIRIILARFLPCSITLLQRPTLKWKIHSRQSRPSNSRRPNMFRNASIRNSTLVRVLPRRFPRFHNVNSKITSMVCSARCFWNSGFMG